MWKKRGGGECSVLIDDMDDALCGEDMWDDDFGAVDEDVAAVGSDVHVFGEEGWKGSIDADLGVLGW